MSGECDKCHEHTLDCKCHQNSLRSKRVKTTPNASLFLQMCECKRFAIHSGKNICFACYKENEIIEKINSDKDWIPFSHKVPKHNQSVAVKSENVWYGEGLFQDRKFVYNFIEGVPVGNPTHWKPLQENKD